MKMARHKMPAGNKRYNVNAGTVRNFPGGAVVSHAYRWVRSLQ